MPSRNPVRAVAAVITVLGALALAGCTSSGGAGTGSSAPTGSAASSAPPSTAGTGGSSAARSSTSSSSAPKSAPSSGASRSSSSSAPPGPAGGPVPHAFVPQSATFVSADDGWVLGTAPCGTPPCTSVVRTRDGGRTWQGIPAPKATLGNPQVSKPGDVEILRFADERNGWAAGRQLYSTHDGGRTWRQQTAGWQSDVAALETGGGWVYAVAGCTRGTCSNLRVYAAKVGSDSWREIGHFGTAQVRAYSDPLVVSGSSWFLAHNGGIFRGANGTVRSPLPSPCPRNTPAVAQLAAADASHLDAVCVSGGAGGQAQYAFYGSTDGGGTWQRVGKRYLLFSGIYGAADNGAGVLLLGTASAASALVRTADDGGHITRPLSLTTGGTPWEDVGFTTANQAVAVEMRTAMFLSRDAGVHWSRVQF